jgi:hypothetical protein
MDSSGVKGKGLRSRKPDGCYTSIASTVCNTDVLSFQNSRACCNDEICKTGMTCKESNADADNWNSDFNPMSLLERSSSLPGSGVLAL